MDKQDKQPNLFEVLNDIDLKLVSKKKKAILLVGLTKVGKSTVFNWLSKIPLRAVQGKNSVMCYEPQIDDKFLAKINGGFKSCTLVPNIVECQEYYIIDTAGFEDKRNQIGTIGVSYALKAILEAFDEVKFVIVIPELGVCQNIENLFNTLRHFLSMFKISQITPLLKSQIFSSASLLINKCKKPQKITSYVQNCLQQLNDPDVDIPSKALILELLDHLFMTDKIAHFKIAQENQKPQNPEFFDILRKKGWAFLNIKQAKTNSIPPNSIVQLLFKALFKKLQQSQKQKITQAMEIRIKSYKQYSHILNEIIGQSTQINKINQINLNSQAFMAKISKFIENYDYYSSERYINKQQIGVYLATPKKLNALKLVLAMHSAISDGFQQIKYQNFQQQFMKSIAKAKIKLARLSDILMKMYSQNTQAGIILLKLKYILFRGLREFEMLFSISQEQIGSKASRQITDNLQQIFTNNPKQMTQNYIKSFRNDYGEKKFDFNDNNTRGQTQSYFANIEQVNTFQSFMNQYRKNNQNPILEYYPLMRQVQLTLAKFSFKNNFNSNRTIIQYLLKGFEYQCEYERQMKRKNCYSQDHYLYRVTIFNALKQILIKNKNYDLAIQIASFNRDPVSACKIYELNLKEILLLSKRKQIMMKYAQYCYGHGRWKQSCSILQELFNYESFTFKAKQNINNMLMEYVKSEDRSRKIYYEYLAQFAFIDVQSAKMQELVASIKKIFINNLRKSYMRIE